jgi:hypothetical protein
MGALRRQYVLPVGLGVAVATLFVFVLCERSRDRAELDKLRREVDGLLGSVEPSQSLSSVSGIALPAVAPTAMAGGETQVHSAISAVDAVPREPSLPAEVGHTPSVSEKRDAYEIAFVGDHLDSTWDARTAKEAVAKIRAALPDGSTFRSFECRAVMCRVETSHADVAAYRKFVKTAFMSSATRLWNGPGFSTRLSDEGSPGKPLVTVSYIAREGQALPAIE